MRVRYIVRAGFKGGKHIATEYDTLREAAHTAADHAFLLGLNVGDSWFKVRKDSPRGGAENAEVWVELERVEF